MGDYLNGKRPQPGRHSDSGVSVTNINQRIDSETVSSIANAVTKEVVKHIGNVASRVILQSGSDSKDGFNNERTLDKLADAMVVQREKSQSNFEDLGNVKETKKNSEEVKKTIDLLKGLD